MLYENLRGGKKVKVYIPTLKRFYIMDVTACVSGGFSISNYDTGKNNLIQGHEFLREINNQDDVDKFFYMFYGPMSDEAYELAEKHYEKNGLAWIF